jgi:hypothetical protein
MAIYNRKRLPKVYALVRCRWKSRAKKGLVIASPAAAGDAFGQPWISRPGNIFHISNDP